MAVSPLFVFSITRSGSTLVQRVLGSYPEVETVSEPWLLIPYSYTLRREGVAAEYTHPLAADAIADFCSQLPRGVEDYREELREFVLRLYSKASAGNGEVRYFLDKTPPYFFVIDEILELFPEARAILLWRNPLSVMASLIHFDGEVWDPARHRANLFGGLARLVRAREVHGDRLHAVRYEDLVTGDEAVWRGVTDHLGLEFDPASLSAFSGVQLEGRFGDPHGVKAYSSLSTEPLEKWKQRINNPLRKAWAVRWLQWLGEERLATMGYSLDELVAQVRSVPNDPSALGADAWRVTQGLVREPWRARARRSVGLSAPSAYRYVLGARR